MEFKRNVVSHTVHGLDHESASALPLTYRCIQALIHTLRQGKAAATWTAPQKAFIFLTVWWFLCIYFWFVVIYVLPLVPILWSTLSWPIPYVSGDNVEDKDAASQGQQAHDVDGYSGARDLRIVDALHVLEQSLQKCVDALKWDNDTNRTRRVFITLVYTYIFWVAAHQLTETRYIVLAIGSILFTWNSPWMNMLCAQLPNPLLKSLLAAMFLGPLQKENDGQEGLITRAIHFQSQVMKHSDGQPTEPYFVFVLYENQRLWPPTSWESLTFPFERSGWTDNTASAMPTKASFQLPPPVEVIIPDANNPSIQYKKTWTWKWVDREWQISVHENVDELGWEYGSVLWTLFGGTPIKFQATRRRRWQRHAMIECHVEKQSATATDVARQQEEYIVGYVIRDSVQSSVHSLVADTERTSVSVASQPYKSAASVKSNETFGAPLASESKSSVYTSYPTVLSKDTPLSQSELSIPSFPRLDIRPRQRTQSVPDLSLSPGIRNNTSVHGIPSPSFSTTAQSSHHTFHEGSCSLARSHAVLADGQPNFPTNSHSTATNSEKWNTSFGLLDKRSSTHSDRTTRRKREAVWRSIVNS